METVSVSIKEIKVNAAIEQVPFKRQRYTHIYCLEYL